MDTSRENIELTPAQQRYVVTRAERVGLDVAAFLHSLVPSADENGNLETASGADKEGSALAAARQFGLVGASSNDPVDLATNPEHMEGLGQNGHDADPR